MIEPPSTEQRDSDAARKAAFAALLHALPFEASLVNDRHEVVAGAPIANQAGTVCGCPLAAVAASGKPATRVVHAESSGRWLECSVYPTDLAHGGQTRLYLHVVSDVTESRATHRLLERSREHQGALLGLLERTHSCESAEQVVREIVDQMSGISWMGLSSGAAAFLAHGDVLRLVYHRRLDPAVVERCARVPFGECFCGRAANPRTATLHGKLRDEHSARFDHVDDRGHVLLPLTEQGETLGVLAFFFPSGQALDPERSQFLDAVARLGSEALNRIQLRSKLLQADRMATAGILAASVAHEVRNPLTYVLFNVETLEAELAKLAGAGAASHPELITADFLAQAHDLREMARDALEGARRIRAIVDDLKIFARQDESERVAVDVNEAAASALRLTANEARFRARIEQDFQELAPVLGSAGRVGQVLLNLVINAAQAIAPGSPSENLVRVRTRQDGDWVNIEVTDSGSGIAPENLPRIFAPFFTTKQAGVGTGLGLAICRDLVVEMGGTIDVESTVGAGTTFRVRLPSMAQTPTTRPPAANVVSEPTTGPRPRVLLVDDDTHVSASIARMLRGRFDVVLAESARAALDLLDGGQGFDAVVSDLMMPNMSGMEFFAELRRTRPELAAQTLFVTGGSRSAEVRDFLERCGRPWLDKPLDSKALLSALAQLTANAG